VPQLFLVVSLNCLCYNKLCYSFDFEVYNCNVWFLLMNYFNDCLYILLNV
jgi:hypothetical protein